MKCEIDYQEIFVFILSYASMYKMRDINYYYLQNKTNQNHSSSLNTNIDY